MRIFIFCFLLVLGVGLTANEPVATLPFKIHRGHMYIQSTINGGRTVNIVFDTGAAVNVANSSLSEEIEFKSKFNTLANRANGVVEMEFSKGNELRLGEDILMKRQDFYLADISHLQDYDLPVDAIVGGTLLNEFVVEIDFEKSIINLYPFNKYTKPTGYKVYPIDLQEFNIPMIEVITTVGEQESYSGRFLLDSGAGLAVSLNTPFVKEASLLEKISPNYEYPGKALGNESMEYVGSMNELSFLDETLNDIPTRMSTTIEGVSGYGQIHGLIGLEVLKRFQLVFNYRGSVMYAKKNDGFSEPFYENKHGLNIIKRKGYFLVNQVIPKSAGEVAKFKQGDQIISVDGKKNLSHDDFESYVNSKKEVTLEVKRGGQLLELKLMPFSMI